MTRAEIGTLFGLLRELYPRIATKLTDNTRAAWYLVLEPFDYQDIRRGLLDWNRGPDGRSFPDPRECIPEQQRQAAKAESEYAIYTRLDEIDFYNGFGRYAALAPEQDPEGFLADLDRLEQSYLSRGASEDSREVMLIRERKQWMRDQQARERGETQHAEI